MKPILNKAKSADFSYHSGKHLRNKYENEIEQVFGQYVMETLLDESGELSEEEATWPCGENHRAGEFCFCGQSEYLQ